MALMYDILSSVEQIVQYACHNIFSSKEVLGGSVFQSHISNLLIDILKECVYIALEEKIYEYLKNANYFDENS